MVYRLIEGSVSQVSIIIASTITCAIWRCKVTLVNSTLHNTNACALWRGKLTFLNYARCGKCYTLRSGCTLRFGCTFDRSIFCRICALFAISFSLRLYRALVCVCICTTSLTSPGGTAQRTRPATGKCSTFRLDCILRKCAMYLHIAQQQHMCSTTL